ncbi:MAG: ribosome maturation factor RimP [Hyphomonas sp.]|nr:ribosome maturation factor RimP [Henriciella sp.]MBO6694913.1 ribosome maturation factor RimP [Henriciella sp.]MCR9224746.1 ribosome maturation factor RimP [Hyphomonas sp.]
MITTSPQEERILAMADPLARELGLDVVRIRIMGGNRPLLQIMIEKAGGAPTDVEDCATFSRNLSPILEEQDPISEAYRLEVSTPGIDRPLTRAGDFGRWVGHLAKLELIMPLEGRRRFQGTIQREDEHGVAILLEDDSELVAQVHEMAKASLILTDELIDAATADGSLPPQPGDDNFEGLETEEAETDTIEDNLESGA